MFQEKGLDEDSLRSARPFGLWGCLVCARTLHTAQPIPDIDDRRSAVSFASNDRKSYTQQSLGAENENLIAAPVAAKGTHNLKSRHYVDAVYRVCDKSRYPDPWGAGVGSSHHAHWRKRKQSTKKVATGSQSQPRSQLLLSADTTLHSHQRTVTVFRYDS